MDSARQLVALTFLRWIKVQPCILWREGESMETNRGEIDTECKRMIYKNRIFSVIVCEVIGYHRVGNVVILVENVNADIHVRLFSENIIDSVENIFGDRNHPFVFQHDNTPAHTACWTVIFLEQQDISTIQWPSQPRTLMQLNKFGILWAFLLREMIWFELCTIPGWTSRCPICTTFTTPFLKSRAVIRGQSYPTKYWLNVCSQ